MIRVLKSEVIRATKTTIPVVGSQSAGSAVLSPGAGDPSVVGFHLVFWVLANQSIQSMDSNIVGSQDLL